MPPAASMTKAFSAAGRESAERCWFEAISKHLRSAVCVCLIIDCRPGLVSTRDMFGVPHVRSRYIRACQPLCFCFVASRYPGVYKRITPRLGTEATSESSKRVVVVRLPVG